MVTLFNYAEEKSDSTACSATVIAPHVVLTAAQCVFPDKNAPVVQSKVFIGSDSTNKKQVDNLGNWFLVKETRFHPEYKAGLAAGNDIGVVVTEDALPVAPMRFRTTPLALDMLKDQPLTVVGVGLTSGKDLTTSGTRTRTNTKVEALSGKDRLSLSAGVLCFGDTGGALVWNVAGRDTVIGVNGLPATETCSGNNHATRTDVYADYISQIVEEFDPGYLGTLSPTGSRDAGGGSVPRATAPEAESRPAPSGSDCAMHLNALTERAGMGAYLALVLGVLLARRARHGRER